MESTNGFIDFSVLLRLTLEEMTDINLYHPHKKHPPEHGQLDSDLDPMNFKVEEEKSANKPRAKPDPKR